VETATQTLHRLTSYGSDVYSTEDWFGPPVDDPRVVRTFEPNDLTRIPWFYKRYAEPLPRIDLPRELPPTSAPAVEILAGTASIPSASLDLPQLSRLLHLSAGVVRTRDWGFDAGRIFPFRAAGSAGGRFPLELYVAVPEGLPASAGVHWYHPADHALVQIGPPPRGEAPTVLATGVPWRTGWRYRERGYRHIYWDAGTMLSQLLAVAESAGLAPRLYTRFRDATVATLVGADTIQEWPVAVVALGDGAPALTAGGPAALGAVDADPIEFPLVTAAQRAGDEDALGAAWDAGAPVDVPVPDDRPLEEIVLARSSQRRMDRTRGVPGSVLRSALTAALRGIGVAHFVAVHDVEGDDPGLYRWPELSSPLRAGDLRRELYHVCSEQGLAGEAAFVVIGAADVGALDDREYREAQLAAGLVEGRLHLLAFAHGASASGMTFVDSEMWRLLEAGLDGLLVTCVGVPEYTPRPGGPPGKPTRFRNVIPRDEI
jgi:hypothetical protein